MRLKRTISLVLMISLLLSCCACAAQPSGAPSGSPSGSPSGADVESKGRYMEEKVQLPMPEGFSEQQLIGVNALENGMEYFTVCGKEDANGYTARYYRHTVIDGNAATASESWLDECCPEGGNAMRLGCGADDALYYSFGDYDENGKSQNHIIVSMDNGKTYTELTGNGLGAIDMIVALVMLEDGRFAAQDMDGGVSILSANGDLEGELEAGGYDGNLAVCGDRLAVRAPSCKAIRVYDLKNGQDVEWELDIPKESQLRMAFSDDGVLYLACRNGLYLHTPDGTIWENFVDGSSTNLGLPNYYLDFLAVKNAERDVLYVSDYLADAYSYTFDPDAAQTASITLDVFSLEDNETVRQAVVAFNRRRSDVKVNYTVASALAGGGTASDYIKSLNTELIAGEGPDVLILDGLPYGSYIEKGVLADITEAVKGAEEMLPNVREAYENNGAFYAVPLGVSAPMVLTKANADNFSSLKSLADAAMLTSGMPMLSPLAYSYETLSNMLVELYGDALYSGGDAKEFLTDAQHLAYGVRSTDTLGEGMITLEGMTEEDIREVITSDPAYPQLYAYARGEAQSVLFTAGSLTDGNCMVSCAAAEQYGGKLYSVGGRFIPVGLAGVNKASKNLKTANEFLAALLSAEVQSQQSFGSKAFPVNIAALEAMFAEEKDNFSTGYVMGDEYELTGGWPSAPMRAVLLDILKSLDKPINDSAELNAMLFPDIQAYVSGKTTLDEAADKLNSALTTYLSE